MQLFNWGALTPEELEMKRRLEEIAFIEEAIKHKLAMERPIDQNSAIESAPESPNGTDGDGADGGDGGAAGSGRKVHP